MQDFKHVRPNMPSDVWFVTFIKMLLYNLTYKGAENTTVTKHRLLILLTLILPPCCNPTLQC